ncbi:hypothetical protein DNI29_14485 [Hymenobacter sediminis]|uniref:hypothetical protein n=1 Tax=Hymenobacter sediminis TaxID=2218621 RepID=UPI000DA6D6A1|nr:hypothetical protein [Hymenobacter sediminis]RPD46209.1 hypothetical protein DNI29_14485 [Hymenobacter sediminis]
MKTSTVALLGIALLLGTDAVAASTASEMESVKLVATTSIVAEKAAGIGSGSWVKRKKRKISPAYRRNMRRHR